MKDHELVDAIYGEIKSRALEVYHRPVYVLRSGVSNLSLLDCCVYAMVEKCLELMAYQQTSEIAIDGNTAAIVNLNNMITDLNQKMANAGHKIYYLEEEVTTLRERLNRVLHASGE